LVHNPCSGTAFMFAKVSFFGRFRTFGKVLCILLSLWGIASIVLTIFFVFVKNGNDLREKQIELDQNRLREDKARGNRRKNVKFLVIAFLLWIFVVLSVELMIRWNSITGVYSLTTVGQLIPFLIGFSGFISIYLAWDRSPAIEFLEKSIAANRHGIEKANSNG
jgi:hypothetical protein